MNHPTAIKSTRNTSAGRRLVSRMTAALALAAAGMAMLGLDASTASAKTWAQTGSPGQVAATSYVTANGSTRQITVNPSVVGESPTYAGYDQIVCVTTGLDQIDYSSGTPRWFRVSTQSRCYWIFAAATSATDWGNNFAGGFGYPGYRVTIDYKWMLSNGYVIGTKKLGYTATSDYWCTGGNCIIGSTNWGGGAFVYFPNY